MVRYGFGVDLGGTSIKLACFDEAGTCADKWEIPTNCHDQGSGILPDIAASLLSYIEEKQLSRDAILGIGIGVPGPVDAAGNVAGCVNLGWEKKNIPQELSQLTGLPTVAGNDANLAALGECWQGAGSKNMILATLGTGVGGGIVVDGRILPGAHSAGGEIGHMPLNPKETLACNCGNHGCAEQYLSATGIVRMAKQALAQPHSPSALDLFQPLTCKDIFDAGRNSDPLALCVLDQYFDRMGIFLSILCSIFDPEVIVLGGGVSRAGQLLLAGARKAFEKYAFSPCKAIRFTIAKLGNDAGVYGAFRLAQQAFLE